jgi:hypothetical protein
LTFCGLGLSNAQLFELSIQEYKKNQVKILFFGTHIILVMPHEIRTHTYTHIYVVLTTVMRKERERRRRRRKKKQDECSGFACVCEKGADVLFLFLFCVLFLIFTPSLYLSSAKKLIKLESDILNFHGTMTQFG